MHLFAWFDHSSWIVKPPRVRVCQAQMSPISPLLSSYQPWPGMGSVIASLTSTTSHELCEAITDPIPGQGWYDDNNGEIGDICAWQTRTLGGYTIQLEWSNQANKCI